MTETTIVTPANPKLRLPFLLNICKPCQHRMRPWGGTIEDCPCAIDGRTIGLHASNSSCAKRLYPHERMIDARVAAGRKRVDEIKARAAAVNGDPVIQRRRMACEGCPDFAGREAAVLVHCMKLSERECRNAVRLDTGECPAGKWAAIGAIVGIVPGWGYDAHGYPIAGMKLPRVNIGQPTMAGMQQPLAPGPLACFFDRVVVISLAHTPDRLEAFWKRLPADWPLRRPVLFAAVYGDRLPTPEGWRDGGGAWGCTLSHRMVLQQAILDGVQRLLVLEDDAQFAEGFADRLAAFLGNVPEDWEQIMLGGQLFGGESQAQIVAPGVRRVSHCERTHAYALQGDGLRSLYRFWNSTAGHCDHRMGEWQDRGRRVYAPASWLIAQAAGNSTILGARTPLRTWDNTWEVPIRKIKTCILRCPRAVVDQLRTEGLVHTGYNRDGQTGVDNGLLEMQRTGDQRQLSDWLRMIQRETAAWDEAAAAVWWPGMAAEHMDGTADLPVVSGETAHEAKIGLTGL